MFDTQPGQHSGLFKRYVLQQISALTSPTSGERPDNVDLRGNALSEVSDWSSQINRKPSSFLPRQSFLTSLGIRQLYGGLRQDDRAEWVECLLSAPWADTLRKLNLSGNPLGRENRLALQERYGPRLICAETD